MEYVIQHRYAKSNNKYMENYVENKESSYLKYLDANKLHGLAMFKKLPADGFRWKKNVLKFNEDFMMQTVIKNIF